MGERRIVHELVRDHDARTAGNDRLRRLVADRDRVAALLRASRRVEPPSTAGAWRSSYATRLWELAATAEPDPALAGPSGHLTLIEPGLDEDW